MPLLLTSSTTGVRPSPDASGRSAWFSRRWWVQVAAFLTVGLVFNLVYAGLYLVLVPLLGSYAANIVSLVVSTVGDTAANRRFTFRVRGRAEVARHQLLGLFILVVGLVVTSGSLWLLQAVASDPGRVAEAGVLVAANVLVGTIRFVTFHTFMRPGEQPS